MSGLDCSSPAVVVVVVVVVDFYSVSRSASNALLVPIAQRKDEFSAPI